MLTVKMLKEMKPGAIFARGEVVDSPLGINMIGSGRQLRWLAVRGMGIHDWAIYCHYAEYPWEFIRQSGDKVCRESHIRKLVLCDDKAFKMYRY